MLGGVHYLVDRAPQGAQHSRTSNVFAVLIDLHLCVLFLLAYVAEPRAIDENGAEIALLEE